MWPLRSAGRGSEALSVLRHDMQERIADTDFGNTIRYCRKVEALYRTFWQNYCSASAAGATGSEPILGQLARSRPATPAGIV